jgi:hypothetical protein
MQHNRKGGLRKLLDEPLLVKLKGSEGYKRFSGRDADTADVLGTYQYEPRKSGNNSGRRNCYGSSPSKGLESRGQS